MNRIFGLVAAVALVLVASTSARADEGQISQAQLAELGLGGMEMVSDAEGTQIRGKFLFNPLFIFNLAVGIIGPPPSTPEKNFAGITVFQVLNNVNVLLFQKFPTHPVFANPAVHYVN